MGEIKSSENLLVWLVGVLREGRRCTSESCMYISADSSSNDTLTSCCDVGGSSGDRQLALGQHRVGVSYRDVCAILMYTEKPSFLS